MADVRALSEARIGGRSLFLDPRHWSKYKVTTLHGTVYLKDLVDLMDTGVLVFIGKIRQLRDFPKCNWQFAASFFLDL